MSKAVVLAWASLTAICVASSEIKATEITVALQEGRRGYTGTADVHLPDLSWLSNLNLGGLTKISIHPHDGLAPIRFDLATIPKRAVVKRATLTLKHKLAKFASGKVNYKWPVEVLECVQAWKEGDGTERGAPDIRGATKSTYDGITEWPEGNVTSALGTVLGKTIITMDRERSSHWHLDVATVQDWISGERENNGMAIWGQRPGLAVEFASSEHKDPKTRPVLTLTLEVPTPLPASLTRFAVSRVSWADIVDDCGRKATEQDDVRSAIIFREKYKGRTVAWSGVVASVEKELVGGGCLIGVTMSPAESLLGSDLTLAVPAKQRDTALALNEGDKVRFVGAITRQDGAILLRSLGMIDITGDPEDNDTENPEDDD
jgi:hypothetical protein